MQANKDKQYLVKSYIDTNFEHLTQFAMKNERNYYLYHESMDFFFQMREVDGFHH
jgi:hypothetical protein